MKWLTYYAAWLCDRGARKMANVVPIFSSMVKYHVPETVKGIIDKAIEVFGGYGYFLEQDVERQYGDNRIVEILRGQFRYSVITLCTCLRRRTCIILTAR